MVDLGWKEDGCRRSKACRGRERKISCKAKASPPKGSRRGRRSSSFEGQSWTSGDVRWGCHLEQRRGPRQARPKVGASPALTDSISAVAELRNPVKVEPVTIPSNDDGKSSKSSLAKKSSVLLILARAAQDRAKETEKKKKKKKDRSRSRSRTRRSEGDEERGAPTTTPGPPQRATAKAQRISFHL